MNPRNEPVVGRFDSVDVDRLSDLAGTIGAVNGATWRETVSTSQVDR